MNDVCLDTWQAIVSFVLHGLDPGGLACAILIGNRPLSFTRAHNGLTYHLVENLLYTVEQNVPTFCREDEEALASWMKRGGLYGLDPEEDEGLFMVFKFYGWNVNAIMADIKS